jgi:predicted transcriptional regulator
MRKIALTSKKELDIYMSPTRQQLLRFLNIENAPMTPKMLADKLQISASGVQHHIKKLMQLGLIELDHTEAINGITASFYKPVQVTVQIGLSQSDALAEQKEVLMQNCIAQVYDGFIKQMKKRINLQADKNPDSLQKWGDILSGVVHLNDKKSEELMKLVSEFIEQNSAPTSDSSPWEYSIIVYNAGEISNE